MTASNLHQLVAELISDPDFLQLQRLERQPNMFSAVGQTFRERWHSAFLGWLFDPNGSHGLRDFPLFQFLVGLAGSARPPSEGQTASCSPRELADLATSLDLSNALVLPNERQGSEKQLGDYGRIDVFVDLVPEESAERQATRFIVLVEVKVRATTTNKQEQRYPDWLEATKAIADADPQAAPINGVCVFLCPTEQLADTSEDTIGDPRWYCTDYQFLHNQVLLPCLSHPDLSPTMRPLLEHYIWNLRSAVKGEKLAVTVEETELARRICASHAKTFKLLAETLKNDDDHADVVEDLESIESSQAPAKGLALQVGLADGKVIAGKNVRALFIAALGHLDEQGLLGKLEIPYSTGGTKRWFLNREPIHQGGQAFNRAVQYEPRAEGVDPFYVEVNASRSRAVQSVKKLMRSAGLRVT